MVAVDRNDNGHADLNPRQRQVLGRCVDGDTDGEIASSLVISGRTVGKHVEAILERTRLRTRIELGAWAAQHKDCCLLGGPRG